MQKMQNISMLLRIHRLVVQFIGDTIYRLNIDTRMGGYIEPILRQCIVLLGFLAIL